MKHLIHFSLAILTFASALKSLSQTVEISRSIAMPAIEVEQVINDFDVSKITRFSGFWNNLNNGFINNFEFNDFKTDGSTFTAEARILAAGTGKSHCNITGQVTGRIVENTIFLHLGEKYQKCSKN
jgi:hypothetical protein